MAREIDFINEHHPIEAEYESLLFLGHYHFWCAKSANPASGEKSPLDGRVFNGSAKNYHVEAHRASNKAMAKVYYTAARELRIKWGGFRLGKI